MRSAWPTGRGKETGGGSLEGLKARALLGDADFEPLDRILGTTLLAGHLLGREDLRALARAQGLTAETFREAGIVMDWPEAPPIAVLDDFRKKLPLPTKVAERIVEASLVRGRKAREQLTGFVQESIQGELDAAITEGKSYRWFKDHVEKILERSGLAPANPHHLKTVFETNVTAAYNAGRIAERNANPALAAIFQWWQYTNADPVTVVCRSLAGQVYRADHDIWRTYTPPNHFRCKSFLTPVSRRDIEDEGLVVRRSLPKVAGEIVRPDVGFRRNVAGKMLERPLAGLG